MEALLNALVKEFTEGWGVPGLILLAVLSGWIYYHYRIFFGQPGDSEGARARHANDLEIRRRWIEERRFETRYLGFLERTLDRVAERWTRDRERLHLDPGGWTGRLFGINPFSEGSYLLCLRLALFYPLLAFVIGWALGDGAGSLSGLELLSERGLGRWLLLIGLGVVGGLYWKASVDEGWRAWAYLVAAFACGSVIIQVESGSLVATIVGAFAFGFACTIAIRRDAPSIAIFTTVFGIAGTLALFFADVGVLAVVLHVAIAVSSEWLRRRIRTRRAIGCFWGALSLLLVVYFAFAVGWTLPRAENPKILLTLTFIGLLPLLNAPLDWLSLGFTRGLLYAIQRGHHTGLKAAGWAFLDLVLALLFLFAIVTLTTGAVALLNALSHGYAEKTLIDLGGLLAGIRRDPTSLDYLWIHFMMLSTLIPTLVHFLVAGTALLLILPNSWRSWMVEHWETRGDARRAAFFQVTFTPLLALAAPLGLLWLLWGLVSGWHGAVGLALLDWVEGVAAFIDPTFG